MTPMTFNITVEQVQAFVQSQPPDSSYKFRDACDCIVAKYAQHLKNKPCIEVVRDGIFNSSSDTFSKPFNADNNNENERVKALIAFFDSRENPFAKENRIVTKTQALEIIQDYLDDE